MKYVSAYLLANLGGNDKPTLKDIEKILGSASLDVDAENANAVINSLKGKKIDDVIAAGTKKLATVPSGGAAPPVAAAAPATSAAPVAAAVSAKKEEKKEESEDEDMGFGLFD